jgi:zinc transport system substrate-binding protein
MPLKQLSTLHVPVVLMSVCCLLMTNGCTQSGPTQTAAKISNNGRSNQIVAVSYPLQYLTRRIAGDLIDVILPIPADTTDPQNWRPSREAIGQMQAADLIIANGTGATYAKWLTTVSLPDSKIRNTASRGLSLSDYIAVEDVTVVHSHGPEGEHSHPTMVARTWLDPAIAKKQANYIASELTKTYPDQASEFASHLKTLNGELDQLTDQIKAIKTDEANVVITATPKLKFFTRSADVGNQHLTWFETPSVDQANADLKKILDGEGPKPRYVLFDGAMPTGEIMTILKENGLQPIPIGLIDRKPVSGDFLSEMRANIETLAAALE